MMASEAWGEADLGGRFALLGCDGHCVFAHSVNGVEYAREVWAARCAPFLPDSEEAGNCAGNHTFHIIRPGMGGVTCLGGN